MLKKLLVAIGIATLSSSSAFAAKAVHKTPSTVSSGKKVAQTEEAKPTEAKGKKGKKAAKKGAEEAAPKAAEPAPAPAPAPSKK